VSWIPCIGDTGINGTITTGVLVDDVCCGVLLAWQDQDNPLSQYNGPSNGPNPLSFEYTAQIVVDDEPVLLSPGQLVTFDVIAAEFGPVATNVQLA